MKKREYDSFIFIRTNQKKVSLSQARTSQFYFIDWNFCKMLTAWNQCSTVKKTFGNWVLDEPHSSLTNRESLESETEGGTNKRSKDRSSLWLQEETSYHESISTNSQAALTLQCEHAITAAKQKSGNSCSSVSSPKWGQHTVNSQTSVGQGRDGQEEYVCVFR